MKNYRERFKRIEALYDNYTQETFYEQLEGGILDDQFEYIFKESSWLEKLKNLAENKGQIELLLDMLSELKERIIEFYINYFKHNRYVGGKPKDYNPDIIIGLGCNNSLGLLDERIERIREIAEVYSHAKVLLSGGGFELEGSEASIMARKLVDDYLFDGERLILEEDSMDTLGNALFSKLLLRNRNELEDIKNILVVTSPFHAVRSRALFRNIFGQDYRILVTGHPYHLTQENFSGYCDLSMNEGHRKLIENLGEKCDIENIRRTIAEHEIRALYRSNKFFTNLGDNIGDETSIFYELFLYDSIYNNRYDILRKYRHVLEKILTLEED